MIVAYIKLSEYCSVGCDHCYLPLSVRENKNLMSASIFNQVVDELIEFSKVNNDPYVSVIWHGGEPLNVPASLYYDYTTILLEKMNAQSIKAEFSMQTSLVPYKRSSRMTDYINEYMEGELGISVDFTARKFQGSSEKYLNTLIKRINACRLDGINVSPNIVISTGELGKVDVILDWLECNNLKVASIARYNSYGNIHGDSMRPSNKEHSDFLISLLDSLISRYRENRPVPRFNVFKSAYSVICGDKSGTWGGGCFQTNYVVNPDGKTGSCPDRISHDVSYSTDDSFVNSKFKNEHFIQYLTGRETLSCQSCEFLEACSTGCPIESNKVSIEGDCAGFKIFLEYFKNIVDSHPDFISWYFEGLVNA